MHLCENIENFIGETSWEGPSRRKIIFDKNLALNVANATLICRGPPVSRYTALLKRPIANATRILHAELFDSVSHKVSL